MVNKTRQHIEGCNIVVYFISCWLKVLFRMKRTWILVISHGTSITQGSSFYPAINEANDFLRYQAFFVIAVKIPLFYF